MHVIFQFDRKKVGRVVKQFQNVKKASDFVSIVYSGDDNYKLIIINIIIKTNRVVNYSLSNNKHENCIKISSNRLMFGPAVLEKAWDLGYIKNKMS